MPDRDAMMIGQSAGAFGGNVGSQGPDVEEVAVGHDAELLVADAGKSEIAGDVAEGEQGKPRLTDGPGQHDMRTRRHLLSKDLTEGIGKEPTATSATNARGKVSGLRSRRRHAE
ncbi:hypothetical protein [Micromonospora musae]|uniref:hypothetical protein n=1 Tax=Micromonospora musae TaxID=1894970 RepID=UPI000EAA9F4C|nr:hypothetical protein [Micromonospora musae]